MIQEPSTIPRIRIDELPCMRHELAIHIREVEDIRAGHSASVDVSVAVSYGMRVHMHVPLVPLVPLGSEALSPRPPNHRIPTPCIPAAAA